MARNYRIGLALGSGAARGWAHIGVIRALRKAGIEPDIYCGTSIGALVGGVHLSGKLDLLEDWARTLSKLKIIRQMDIQFSGGGLIAGRRLNNLLSEELGPQTFDTLPVPFTCVATDLLTGHEVWLNEGSLISAMRCSYALPGLFQPQNINGQWLVDGALVNPVPVSVCRTMGAHIVLAVNLNSDIIGRNRIPKTRLPKAAGFDLLDELPAAGTPMPGGVGGFLIRQIFRRQPNTPSLFGVMVQSLTIMQDRITRSRLAGEPPDVEIKPRVGHIGMLEFDRAEDAIAEGRIAVERVMPEIRDAMAAYEAGGA